MSGWSGVCALGLQCVCVCVFVGLFVYGVIMSSTSSLRESVVFMCRLTFPCLLA